MKRNISIFLFFTFSLNTSCTNIAKGLLLPNQCKRCEVYNTHTGEIITVYEGCGASNVRLEESAKIYAFDLMQSEQNCNYNIRCTSWKQEPPEQ